MPANENSQGDTLNASPRTPPIASTVVPSSTARAPRCSSGLSRNTQVPTGASISSPSTVNVARPVTTT